VILWVGAENVFKPMTSIQIDAQIAEKSQRLLNGLLTEFKMNLRADHCESQLELVGTDSPGKGEALNGPAFLRQPRPSVRREHSSGTPGNIGADLGRATKRHCKSNARHSDAMQNDLELLAQTCGSKQMATCTWNPTETRTKDTLSRSTCKTVRRLIRNWWRTMVRKATSEALPFL